MKELREAANPKARVVVAVHGIGDQRRNETVRSVANRFATDSQAHVQLPLGFFHGTDPDKVKVRTIHWPPDKAPLLDGCGFCEIYWADIPQKAVNDAHTLEGATLWAQTVVARVRAVHGAYINLSESELSQAANVLSDMVETIDVIDNLLFIVKKAGIFEFELKKLLDEYLGDVQLVAEYADTRQEITDRFDRQMGEVFHQISGKDPDQWNAYVAQQKLSGQAVSWPEIHLVTHSEGTVVAFLSLLLGLQVQRPWALAVRSLATLGSPIDKHLVLWPDMWDAVTAIGVAPPEGYARIQWANYYDYGDPVGFSLDTVRWELRHRDWGEYFEFPERADFGFSRYLMPGAAHNEYWTDEIVFKDIWKHGVGREPRLAADGRTLEKTRQADVPNRTGMFLLSTVIPYLICALLHVAAIAVIYLKVVGIENLQQPLRVIAANVSALSALLMGMTLATRMWRLTKDVVWRAVGWLGYLAGVALYWLVAIPNTQVLIGRAFAWCAPLDTLAEAIRREVSCILVDPVVISARLKISAATLLVVLISMFISHGKRRFLITSGAALTILVVLGILRDQASAKVVVPLLLSAGGFLYLWWLAVLLFDLCFTWHRYIRCSKAQQRLAESYQKIRSVSPTATLRPSA